MEPPQDRAGDRPPPKSPGCPNCGAPYEPDQEYCLECGARLPAFRKARIPPALVAAAVAALLLAIGGVVAGVLLAGGGDEPQAASSSLPLATTLTGPVTQTFAPSTDASPTTGSGADTGLPPAETTLVPQGTNPTLTEPSTTPPATNTQPGSTTPTQTTTQTQTGTSSGWPAGESGYTVILASIPQGSGEASAESEAERARAAGLSQVGVLNSSEFSSLRPGYYAVFSGVYSSLDQARSGLPQARAAGYSEAYTRHVVP